ncbi:MAG TPA: prepilin peptidase [Patescibacteria group bacterium]|nr:prepilin peptidase [Patescibacteria group bacterium]
MFIFKLLSIILGLVFGSFFSALSYRYPRGISNSKGRSMCPKCKNKISWFDNIPVYSFLLLGGKCRECKGKISWRYPIIELTTAFSFLFLYTQFSDRPLLFFYSIIVLSILILILIIDFEHKIIPDTFVFLGISFSVVYLLLTTNGYQLVSGLSAGFLSAFLLLLLHIITKGRGMGLGDVKFAVWGGILVGLKLNLIWLFLAFLTGGVAGIILITTRRAGLKDQIAFGPFLIISIALTFFLGEKLRLFMGF